MSTAQIAARLLRTRWFVRAPIALFRARLGFLFGSRLLLLEHHGRKTGQRRFVALETVDRPDPATVIVASGFGTGAQWYRNLRADPNCRITLGFHYRVPARARVLPPEQAHMVLAGYQIAHPAAYRELSGIIEAAIGGSIDDVPLVELSLRP